MKRILVVIAVVTMLSGLANAATRDVVIDTELGPLAGSILEPDQNAPVAMALIIAGSGPTDRNGNSRALPGNNNSLRMLAEGLLEAGIASFRYDKRMIGESATPDLGEADLRFDHYVDDAVTLLEYLGSEFKGPIFVIGHSEGAHIALLSAARAKVAGVIAIAGAGRPAGQLILDQVRPQLPSALMTQTESIVAELEAGRTVADTPAVLAALFRDSVQPYLISWFAHDPADAVAALDVPVLLAYGTTDIQVQVADGERLADAGSHARLEIIEGMNHVLKMVPAEPSAQQRSYGDPALPVSSELLEAVVDFVLSR